ncbi:MAG TPA: NmrA family NAD(P)-binding protein [Nannocystaceae bacterium]|nr:NmrA family NAD(P)-binding protein [Nannocystaceae bacterium]
MFVITGATGHTGAVAADTLLAQGERVRVVVRERGKAERFAAKGAEVAVADMADADALTKALTGARGAYLLVPPNMAVADFRAYQREVSDAIVEAVTRAKVPHVVLLSSIGAQLASGNGPIAALHDLEDRLEAIPSLATTSIRAASFMENLGGSLTMLGQGLVTSFHPADFAYERIATADIGKLAAAELREGGKSSIIELGSDPISANDIAAVLTKLVGQPIKVAEAPLDAVVPTFMGFGMPQQLAELYREMLAGFGSRHIGFEGGHRRIRGTTELATVLAGLLGKG